MFFEKASGRAADSWALGVLLYYMCTFEYPFGDPYNLDNIDRNLFLASYSKWIKEDPVDMSKVPEHYSEKTKEFILILLEKEWSKWPLIKDILPELNEHAFRLFKESGVNINFPVESEGWEEIKERLKKAIEIPDGGL